MNQNWENKNNCRKPNVKNRNCVPTKKIFELNLIQINNLENDIQESFKYQKKVE